MMSAPRITGLIAAAVFGLLVVVVAVRSFTSENIMVPTNGVTAGGARDNPSAAGDPAALASRARLQEWPGSAGVEPRANLALGAAEGRVGSGDGARLTQEWLSNRGAYEEILQDSQFRSGVSPLPSPESSVLMQPQGRSWRNWRNDQIAYGGGLYILGLTALIALFLAWRGRIPIKEGEDGRTVERFTAFERANHWLTAVSFLLMALTGLIILYGNASIRPWLGAGAYAELARVSAWSHMTFAVPFFIGVIVMIAMWTFQNIPERLDWHWLRRGGGFVSDKQESPPARKFNAGQKLVFWGVALGGLFLAATGLGLMFPFFWTGYTGMQWTQSLHAAAGLLMIGLIIGHIYIGTIGMRGAFDAMWTGQVDRNWAKEHHSLWYRTVANDTRPRERSQGGAVATFTSGAAVAVVLALAIVALYQTVSITDVERTASFSPSSVKVDIAQPQDRRR